MSVCLSLLAAFIIPYLIMLFMLGIPLFYLETTFGQMMRSGPITAWKKLVPNLWGIGLASVIVTIYIALYYNVIMGWVIFYFFSSFQDPLPWGKCANYTITTNVTLNNLNLQTFVGSPMYIVTGLVVFWEQADFDALDQIASFDHVVVHVSGIPRWSICFHGMMNAASRERQTDTVKYYVRTVLCMCTLCRCLPPPFLAH